MTDSLRLLLEDFLGLMREEGELDVFLPLLMSAMGHEVVYRPQKGPRQYGVDIASVGPDSDGQTKLFLWLVKCGDIGRTDWDTGPQSVRQSINDVGDIYLRSHIAPEHKALKRKLLIVTNGDFSANLNETIAAFLEDWSRRKKVATEQVNGSKLAAWTERFLLDEYILPSSNRSLLRRMLANVSSPELCVMVGRRLINEMLSSAVAPAKTAGARTKRLLTGLRGIRTTLRVLSVWAANEENLLAPYILSQYAVLAVWSKLHERLKAGDAGGGREFSELLFQLASVAEAYHRRMDSYYVVQDAFADVLPDSVLVSRTVFDELGRLGQQGCFWAFYAALNNHTDSEYIALRYANRVQALVQSHSCSALPAYDYHSASVHAALLLLVVTGQHDVARTWVQGLCQRMHYATSIRKFLPMSASFEEAVWVRHGYEQMEQEFCSTSTLVPILLTWTAALAMDDGYTFLREDVVPRLDGSTPNFWSAEGGYDAVIADPNAFHEHGIGEAVKQFHEDPREFLRLMSEGLAGVDHIEQSAWYQVRAPYIPLLAALHWQGQLPRQMLVQQAMAFAGTQPSPAKED
jgi:hypothetical protein